MKYDFTTLRDRLDAGSAKWKGMYEKKKDIPKGTVPFSVADMEFVTTPEIVKAMSDYVNNISLGYTQPTNEYFDAVCAWMKEIHNWNIKPEEIVITPGVVPALFYCVDVLTKAGDGVIIMPPVYGPFFNASCKSNRKTVLCPLINDNLNYSIDFALLEVLCKKPENTMLIFCNPHNPTGCVWSEAELRKLGKICTDNNVLILSDEIHCDIIMPGYKHFTMGRIVEIENNLVVCTAPSKTFNIATMQTANTIVKNPEIRNRLVKYKADNHIESMNALGFVACISAYTNGRQWMNEMLDVVNKNYIFVKKFLANNLQSLKMSEMMGTYLAWIDCRTLGLTSSELEKVLINYNLFVNNGTFFGEAGEGFIRINLACPKQCIEDAMNKLKKVVESI